MIAVAGSVMGIVRLHRLSKLQRYSLCATDGEIGSVEEVYFDDATWTVRYFAARPGPWLEGREVLISSIAIGDIDDVKHVIHVELPRPQIIDSPPLETARPVSRRYEAEFFRYYGWPPYWDTAPSAEPYLPFQHATAQDPPPSRADNYLRSSAEVEGYRIAAADGHIGHVSDFIIDEKTWQLSYLVIDTRNWLPGKHVLLNSTWIDRIDWPLKSVIIDLRCDAIRSAPAYDTDADVGRDYEIRLFEHYARKKYWE